MDEHDYSSPAAIQEAFVEHYKEFLRDIASGNGHGQSRHLGVFRMHENRLMYEYNYSVEMINKLIARAQLELEAEKKKG